MVWILSKTIDIKTFEVEKSHWLNTRVQTTRFNGDLKQNEVLFEIDRFALTSNNISYASAGDMLGYWQFFPTTDGYGRIPAMGYANVIQSNHPDIEVGNRYWGFYPMSTHLVAQAGKITKSGFSDVSKHREKLAPIYSRFDDVRFNPLYEAEREDHDLLLRGLFLTSWLVDDFMFDNDHFGADAYAITCASSKTSIALAFVAKQRGLKKTIGITSEKNRSFTQSLDCYDEVISYDEVKMLDNAQKIMIVDMAGHYGAMKDLHEHFDDHVKYSCKVGATHLDNLKGDTSQFPGAKPTFFFAPTQAQKRTEEWGAGEVQKRIGMSLKEFQIHSDQWMTVKRDSGLDEIKNTFTEVVQGNIPPNRGIILSV
jgi:hypothetical protein